LASKKKACCRRQGQNLLTAGKEKVKSKKAKGKSKKFEKL